MKTPCLFPGCAALLDKGGYCDTHAHHAKQYQRNADKRRMSDPTTRRAAIFRSSGAWYSARRAKMTSDPLCEDPHGHHGRNTETAVQVHHVQPLATHYHLRLHQDNLMSLCVKCHDVFNRRERANPTEPTSQPDEPAVFIL